MIRVISHHYHCDYSQKVITGQYSYFKARG